jgi:hypothetical protein
MLGVMRNHFQWLKLTNAKLRKHEDKNVDQAIDLVKNNCTHDVDFPTFIEFFLSLFGKYT